MRKILCVFVALVGLTATLHAQIGGTPPASPTAIEIESLVPMFFYGGYHAAVAFRFDRFRVRASIINSGSYDAEPAGLVNSSPHFSRYYDNGSCGVFFDYFPFSDPLFGGLHVYAFFESHQWRIVNNDTKQSAAMHTFDVGPGLGYQLLFWNLLYIQPGIHFYFRSAPPIDVGGEQYTIPSIDFSPVLRIGVRWSLG